jgi:Uma2 family endonuclease
MNWTEVCQDPALADLPYKIELDKHGKIIMSPAHKKHSIFQGRILRLLNRLMSDGEAAPELAVDTAEGTKVPDVAWISNARLESMRPEDASCSIAPEICIEILSQANTREEMLGRPDRPGKRELYFQRGAQEFWLCDESGQMQFFDASGQIVKSRLCPEFPDRV